MGTFLMIICILLIVMVLLQSGKAESASNIIQGGNSDLFSNRKERGGELLITRITFSLGIIFMITAFIMSNDIISKVKDLF